jgi:hypothetical protein
MMYFIKKSAKNGLKVDSDIITFQIRSISNLDY